MITRLLTLALAATGLSVGGFQLGARQTSAPSPVDVTVPADLPSGHALTVALQEPNSRVSMTDKDRLRYLAAEMESAKKTEGEARVRILREKIKDLERQVQIKRLKTDLYEVRSGDKVMRIRTPDAKPAAKAKAKSSKKADTAYVRYLTLSDGLVRDRLETVERRRADSLVERRYEDIAIQSLPSGVRTRVQAEARGLRAEDGERGFALLIALRERVALNLTPPQVTKLQLLQADFLRRFAPLREESETGVGWTNLHLKKKGEEATIAYGTFKARPDRADQERVQVVEGNQITIDLTKPTWTYSTKSDEKSSAETDVVYVVDTTPVRSSDLKEVTASGKTGSTAKRTSKDALTFRVVVANPGDVEKRIQALKAEIDDKVYEVLNDDQGKRLRRMVAVSLSPQP